MPFRSRRPRLLLAMFEHGWTEAKETGTLGPDHQRNMAVQRFDYINDTPVGARLAVT